MFDLPTTSGSSLRKKHLQTPSGFLTVVTRKISLLLFASFLRGFLCGPTFLPTGHLFLTSSFTGKSAGCPAFLPLGRGGEESRPYNHIFISRKPHPLGGELQSSFLDLFNTYLLIFVKVFLHSSSLWKKEDIKRVHANALGEDKFPRRDALSFGQ